ncbi:Histidyl-tRNA synthetase [Pyrodictium delaneyi]|uniref:Histidine--tRNA ligase n=1 Tax=Pyrodictium delaneyi TaxID=1273541 RepID=A0A0P0N5E0_9CREN|nr:histidine--tRNA ligase [Pyrodictium delaneyi]ALL01728.1 Histidyl-tRNA synthetase [Pyrodictium delaneyi]OWJ55048.1 histidine--tRNA ligase [Pyrodictium delaneyi]
MTQIVLEPLRGFRDILPPESRALSRLAEIFTEVAEAYGYREVKPPTLERFQLFAVKSGEEIRRSMYVFKDKAGREVALRPEATASIARIYLKHLRGEPKPLRLYYVVNCFRYEEPQKARYREFWQAGIELLGEPSILGDFEVIRILVKFYERIEMLDHIVLKIGTTKLYRHLFSKYNISEDIQDHILHLMDKDLYNEAINVLLETDSPELADLLEQLWSRARNNIEEAKKIVAKASEEAAGILEEFNKLIKMLREYNNQLRLDVDLAFARGLAYYTGTIFEVKVPGFPVSIAGGGRYDNLIELYGGEKVPGTGFAIGLDRTLAAIQELGLSPKLVYEDKVPIAIIVLDEALAGYAARVQDILAAKSTVTTSMYVSPKLQKILPKLAKQGYRYAVIIGRKEAAEEKVVLRDLLQRRQDIVSLDELSNVEFK